MKKLFALLLALVMCLTFVACGGNNTTDQTGSDTTEATSEPTDNTSEPTDSAEVMSKEEMLEIATEIDDYKTEMKDNIARAEAKYIGNIYLVTGNVSNISKDTVDVGDFTVPLPSEDIMKVCTGQRITVVGKIESMSFEEVTDGWGISNQEPSITMSEGYFVTDITEVTGTLIFYYMKFTDINGKTSNRDGNPEAWVIGLDMTEDNVLKVQYHMEESIPVNHVSGQKITSVQFGGQELASETRITVSGKVFYENGEYVIRDADLVSVG